MANTALFLQMSMVWCCLIWSHLSTEPLWAIRLPDLCSTPPLLPHLHILPGAGDAWQDLWPDRIKLPPALGRRNDGYGYGHGHGSGQAQHRAGLLRGGKHQLKSDGTKYSLGWIVYVGLTPNCYFFLMYIEVNGCIHIECGAKAVLKVCFALRWYHCNMKVMN